MKKIGTIVLMSLSLVLVSLLLISCKLTGVGSECLSREELEAAAAMSEGEKAVAGQAYKLNPITWLSCLDSDGGINLETAGSVSGVYSQSGNKYDYNYNDVCKENLLKEFSCKENKFVASSMECKYGCKNGACLPNVVNQSQN